MQYCSVHVRKYHCMLFYFFPCLCIYDASELQIPLHRKSQFLWNNRYLVQVTGSVSILSVFLKTDLYPYNQFQFQPYGLINSRTITFHSYGNMYVLFYYKTLLVQNALSQLLKKVEKKLNYVFSNFSKNCVTFSANSVF